MSDDRAPKDDALLDALRATARAEDKAADALWDAVVAGNGDALPPDGPSLEALRPLDDGERADLVGALFGDAPAEAAPVIDLADRRRRRFITAGFGLAIAAGVGMLFVGRGASLPEYALEVRAGEQVLRGEEVRSHTYTDGSVLSAVLRPAVDAEVPVDAAVVLVPADGPARVLSLPVQRTATGAIRITGIMGRDIDVGPGRYSLVFLVAPQGQLPSDPSTAHTVAPVGGQRLQHDFRVSKPD